MRIAYLTHVNVRGTRAHVHNTLKTCEALANTKANVTLISTDTPPSSQEWSMIQQRHTLRTEFQTRFLNVCSHEQSMHPSPWVRLHALIKANIALMRYLWIYRHEIDVIYYRFHLYVACGWFWRFFVQKPVVFESHYVYINNALQQSITSLAVHSANAVVTITRALQTHYHLPERTSIVAPCHAAEIELVPSTPKIELRQQLKIPKDTYILCYTGSIGSTIQGISYEVETLIDILPKLPEKTISLIIGSRDAHDAEPLRAHAQKLDVSNRVILLDWVERHQVMRYLAASDALLIPRVGTAAGSSPSKMFDYLAVGIPIIAAHTPSVDEILSDTHNALLVHAEDTSAWINAVRRIQDNRELATRISKGARKTAEKYTWKHRGSAIYALISKLL